MSNLKKLFFVAVSVMTVFGVVGFVPSGASAATAGSLIKMAGNSAVYYFDGTKRYVFPQENVYKTWYKDFSGVMTISQAELQTYPIGGNVTMRPGTWMVKITTDPKVYAVTPGGVLHHVDSESRALALWGANWNKMIVDVSDAFFVNYSTGTALSSNVHPTGSLIKRGTSYYYVDNGNERPFASDAALTANMMNTAFAIETTMDYPDGSSITGMESALTNVAGSSSTVGTSAAGLTVSGGTMTASTSLPKGANVVKVGEWNFAAGPEGAVTLNQVTWGRTGVGNTSDISALYVYDGANRLTSSRTLNTSTNEVTFTLNLSIPAGSTKILSLYVSISTTAAAGDEHVFGVSAASKVSSNAASVNGIFPINSNKHSIAGATAGEIQLDKSGSVSNPRVGDRGVKMSEFKLTASTEDAWINQVTLTQGGNVSNSAMSNFMLKQNGVLVSSASAIASNDRLDFVFSPSFKIEKGNNRIFELFGDVDGRPLDTILFYIDESADLMATGGTFGVGMTSDITAGPGPMNLSTLAHQLALQGGQFTISFDGPASANISNAAADVMLWKGTIYSANQVEVRNWRFRIQDQDDDTIDLINDANAEDDVVDATEAATVYVQDLKLWNLDNNTVIAGPLELSTTTGASTLVQNLQFTDDYTFNAGSTTHIGFSADIRNTPASSSLNLLASMSDGTNSFSVSDIKNVGSNTYLTLGTDIVPSTPVAGKSQTVTAAALTVTMAPSPTDQTTIVGASGFTAAAFNFAAGSGSSVKITSLAVRAGVGGAANTYGASGAAAGGSATVANIILSVKLMDGTTQVGNTKTFSSGLATFDSLSWTIPASQTKKLDVVITTNSAVSLGTDPNYLRFVIDLDNYVTAIDSEGNTLADAAVVESPTTTNEIVGDTDDNGVLTSGAAADAVLSLSAVGSLTVALAPTPTNPASGLVASGTTDKVLAAYKFEATNESFFVKKLDLMPYVDDGSPAVDAASNDRIAVLKVRYPKQAGGTETRTVGLSGITNLVDISDTPMYVPQNGSGTLEVLADFATFTQLTGSEDENIAFSLDANNTNSNNLATGVASGTDDLSWGSDVTSNRQNVYRTILTVAAGSGTPNGTARSRSSTQKVASYNLSATSTSNALFRGSTKAADGSATGWAVLGTTPTVAASTAQKVSGSESILFSEDGSDALNDGAYYNFGSATALDKYNRASMWVRASVAIVAGDYNLFTNDTANLTGLIDDISIGAVGTTGRWTYIDVAVAPTGAQYAGIYQAANDGTMDAQTIYIDDFRFYRDSLNVDLAGDFAAITSANGSMFSLKDSGGTTRMYGAYNGTSTAAATIKLIAGNGADVDVVTVYSDVEISSSALALDLEGSTTAIMAVDVSGVAEGLNVSIDTGNVSSAGDFVWYDNSDTAGSNDMDGITVVAPLSTTVTFSNTY